MGRIVFEFHTNPLILRQVELIGSMGGGVDDLAGVYDLMASGQLNPAITTMSFDEIDEGLDRLRQGTVTGRIVIDMQDGI